MKNITNWRNASVADVETDGLLKEATKYHVLSCELANGYRRSIKGSNLAKIRDFFKYHIDNNIPVVFHNGIAFDIPVSEKLLGIDLSELMVIDTLFISWYLNIDRKLHGLDSFFEDYGIAKVKVKEEEWKGLTEEEEDILKYYEQSK